MRNKFKTALALAIGAAALSYTGLAAATPSTANGVFFVHGTGDYTFGAAFNPTTGTAVTDYWTQDSLNSMRTSPAGGYWNYGVAGYQGGSQNAQTSWSTIANQIMQFYRSYGPLLNIVVVTHSNGSNPIRYMLAHPTATFTQGGTTYCAAKLVGGTCSGTTYTGIIKKVVFIAGDNKGTPLADKVTTSGSIANIGNSILTFFGGDSWAGPGVVQQIQANMTTYNSNGTFATGTTPGGMSTNYIYGSDVYANVFSSDAWCGGYATTTGLKAAQLYGWGSTSAATDGFIGTASSTYVGTDPNGYGGDSRLNHNQSRRSCHGSAPRIAAYVHGAMSGTFDSIPTDYAIAPSAQACNATTQGWQTASPYAGNFYWYGCTSSMKADTSTDFDCQTAYGGDNGYNLPASTYTSTVSSYFVSSYYSGSGGCSDTWAGDGECDLCLLAKYGFDSASGSTAGDDCVNQGTGTTSHCADLAYYDQTSAIGYYSYDAVH